MIFLKLFWINNSIAFSVLIEWIFWILFWIESFFRPDSIKKLNFQKRSPVPRGEDFPCQAVAQLCLAVQALLYLWMCYTEIHVGTTLISILWCCLPSLPHLSSLLLLFLQLSRMHLLQQCRVAVFWLLMALNILYGVVSGGRVHICTQCWGCPYQHLDKAACQLGLAGKGKGSSDMVLDWTKEKSALLKPTRIFSDCDLD